MSRDQNKEHSRRRTQHERSHTETGLCRITQTAVPPWSCCDTCVLRLTRVRAQPQASKSVSRACVMFHATAYTSFSCPSRPQPTCCEEFTPFCAAALSNSRRRTQYERSRTGTDYVVLRRRRSRLGAASYFIGMERRKARAQGRTARWPTYVFEGCVCWLSKSTTVNHH